MDRLSQLPEELIENICNYLPEKRDLQYLRLCCKRLKETSSHAFDDRHLGVVKAMITRDSLQRLIELSKQDRFRKAIKELEIYLVAFPGARKATIDGEPATTDEINDLTEIMTKHNIRTSAAILSEGVADHPQSTPRNPQVFAFYRKLRRRRRRLYDRHRHEQNTMRATGTDVELLAEVLRNLPALKSIRTVNKLGRTSPPLGTMKLYDEIGIWPLHTSDAEWLHIATHSISLVFGATLRSGCRLETVDFCGVPYHLPLAKTVASRKSSRTSTPATTFAQSRLAELNLSKLHHLSLSLFNWKEPARSNAHGAQAERPLHWLALFVPHLTAIRKLSLTGTMHNTGESLIHSLVSVQSSFSQLRSLELEDCDFRLDELHQLLQRNRLTLRSFVCLNAQALHTNQQIGRLLLDLPQMRYVDVSTTRWPRSTEVQYVIYKRTPEEFQNKLSAILA